MLSTVNADRMQQHLRAGQASPETFRSALTHVPPAERDTWLDRVFGLDELPDDGEALPRGCVPYLPTAVDTLLRAAELAEVGPSDVFVDVGSGIGRATTLMHFLTGASAMGLEIQPALVGAARDLATRLNAPRVTVILGDAAELTRHLETGTVFFLYCPFHGERLERVMGALESIATVRAIRVCSVNLTLPACAWLSKVADTGELTVYRSL
jgi:SAM-dependent methyltransferase